MISNTQNDAFDNSSDVVHHQAIRQSTTRRIEKIRQLLIELAHRDLNVPAAALHLQVSFSAARNYLYELRDAGITAARTEGQARSAESIAYRLCADAAQVQNFLVQASTSTVSRARPASGGKRKSTIRSAGRFLHIMADDVKFPLAISRVKPQRDPLVAALFGAAIESNNAAA